MKEIKIIVLLLCYAIGVETVIMSEGTLMYSRPLPYNTYFTL